MLPSSSLLEQIPRQIFSIPNKRKESKRSIHYCCYLLCEKAGLRVSEAVNFDLSTKTKKGLYRLNKTKGQKERFVYIPKSVINELKKHAWKPNSTSRFNFYHFLRKIKRELGISQNVELTPHTLRRTFATYQAESGLPLPLLQKLLGHKSIRTTALYWLNIYNDEGNDADDILTGKVWLEKPKKPPLESAAPVKAKLEEFPRLPTPQPITSEFRPNYLSKIQHLEKQLSQIQAEKAQKITELTREKEALQNDLTELSEQNTILRQEKNQIATEKDQTINQLTQELAKERKNSAEQKQVVGNLHQQLRNERKINANLKQKLHAGEQNYLNLQNAYQKAIKDKEITQKQANYYEQQLKAIAKMLHQWQKANYYQQLEKQRTQIEAKILHPPPWKPSK